MRSLQEPESRLRRLLIVDDEPLMLRALARALRQQYEVKTLSSPAEALRELAVGGSCDIVLADVTMPEMDGIEFAERVVRARADLADRIILMTGGAFTPRASAAMERCRLPVMPKPLELTVLRDLLARLCPAAT
jgi:DNA-binding NtrC family response regulator